MLSETTWERQMLYTTAAGVPKWSDFPFCII
jgi:hypothetical protein